MKLIKFLMLFVLLSAGTAMADHNVEYSIFCITENQWVSVVTNVAPTNCPNNPAHTVKTNSVRVSNANPNFDVIPHGGTSRVGLPGEPFAEGYFDSNSVHVGNQTLSQTDVANQKTTFGWGVIDEYVSGCLLVYSDSNKVTMSSGKAATSDNSDYVTLSTNITLSLAVSGDNGLDTGSEASNTWYAVYVAYDASTNAVGVFSTNGTSPTGYTNYRRVGWIWNDDAKDIRMFLQRWDGPTRRYYWNTTPAETRVLQNGTSATYADLDLSDYVPVTSENTLLQLSFETGAAGTNTDSLRVKAADVDNATLRLAAGVVSGEKMIVNGDVATDSTQKISYKVDDAANNRATILVKGFDDDL